MARRARPRAATGQLELFAPAPRAPDAPEWERARQRLGELARRVPGHVRLGTSSWTFPGWGGTVYPAGVSERELVREGLRHYVEHPLFRTVGVDRSYYRPLDRGTLAALGAQLPPRFPCVWKAWSEITAAVDARTRAPNPRFLDARLCREAVIEPMRAEVPSHVGAIVLELAPLRRRELPAPAAFAERLDSFLAEVAGELPLAVELRNRELLTPAYLEVLARHRVAHVVSSWERMPPLGEQLEVPGILTAPHVVARLLLPPGVRYAEQRERFAPFDRIVEPQPALRDAIVRLAAACARDRRTLFVLVNNKVDGSAPLTVLALAERLAEVGSPTCGDEGGTG
ncbi:MAG: DUF72 domain-containing protein [Polyangiaceae bacterium]|nr:DUF72 domain-containing protein [Polyangiaceae bacterium]